MKKLITTLLFCGLSLSAFSATTGTLLVQGAVARKVSIVVSAESIASALDLSTSQNSLKVATINEKSNSKTGYDITITSANLGKLKRTDGAEVFAYTLQYDGAAVGLSTAAGTTFSRPFLIPVNVNRNLTVSYTGKAAETMVEGIYADTVTLNIAAR